MNEEIMDTIGYDTAIDGKLVYWFDFCVFLIITFRMVKKVLFSLIEDYYTIILLYFSSI